jgi:hypothetical protein
MNLDCASNSSLPSRLRSILVVAETQSLSQVRFRLLLNSYFATGSLFEMSQTDLGGLLLKRGAKLPPPLTLSFTSQARLATSLRERDRGSI